MRLRLDLRLKLTPPQILPVNYQYPVSAWIYKTISLGNQAFADFLHAHGFGENGKSYKFFSFSWLSFPPKGFRVIDDRLEILQRDASIEVSFLAPLALQNFVVGLFQNQNLSLGDKQYRVDFQIINVQSLEIPELGGAIEYRTASPMLISNKRVNSHNANYLSPDADGYTELFRNNLIARYNTARGCGLLPDSGDMLPSKIHFNCNLASIKRKGFVVKANTPAQTKLIAYHCEFQLDAPPPIHQLGYMSGFGEKNSLGLGYVNILNP